MGCGGGGGLGGGGGFLLGCGGGLLRGVVASGEGKRQEDGRKDAVFHDVRMGLI